MYKTTPNREAAITIASTTSFPEICWWHLRSEKFTPTL